MNKFQKTLLSAMFLMVAFVLLSLRLRILIEFIPLVFVGLSLLCFWSAQSEGKRKKFIKNPGNWTASKYRGIGEPSVKEDEQK